MYNIHNCKVGTTTWKRHFLDLLDEKNILMEEFAPNCDKPVPDLFRISSLQNTNIKSLAEQSTSFSMVRHPFERLEKVFLKINKIQISRLVSAFQDKLVDNSDKFYKRVVDHIVNTYGEMNFENFVHMVIKNSKTLCRRLNKCSLDVHWKPFISRCGYCDIPYKVIARAENFAEDQKFIGKLANIDLKPLGRYI